MTIVAQIDPPSRHHTIYSRILTTLALLFSLGLMGCAHSPAWDPNDPVETVNRATYRFNEGFDYVFIRPFAWGYDKIMPGPIRRSIGQFFTNLGEPRTVLNDLLQGKGRAAGVASARFLINSTIGLGGLFDPASHWGLDYHKEDFGQTFGYWGIGQGSYWVLPFLGPSSNRDAIGALLDAATNPVAWLQDDPTRVGLTGLDVVHLRAELFPLEKVLKEQNDRYLFVRTSYLQKRENDVHDGNPPEEEFDF